MKNVDKLLNLYYIENKKNLNKERKKTKLLKDKYTDRSVINMAINSFRTFDKNPLINKGFYKKDQNLEKAEIIQKFNFLDKLQENKNKLNNKIYLAPYLITKPPKLNKDLKRFFHFYTQENEYDKRVDEIKQKKLIYAKKKNRVLNSLKKDFFKIEKKNQKRFDEFNQKIEKLTQNQNILEEIKFNLEKNKEEIKKITQLKEKSKKYKLENVKYNIFSKTPAIIKNSSKLKIEDFEKINESLGIASKKEMEKEDSSSLLKKCFSEESSSKKKIVQFNPEKSLKRISTMGIDKIKQNLSNGFEEYMNEMKLKKSKNKEQNEKVVVYSQPKNNAKSSMFMKYEEIRITKLAHSIMFSLLMRHFVIKTIYNRKIKMLQTFQLNYKETISLMSEKIKYNLSKTLNKIWNHSNNLSFFSIKSDIMKFEKLYSITLKKCTNVPKTTKLIYAIVKEILENLQIKKDFKKIKNLLLEIFSKKSVFHPTFFFLFELEYIKITSFGFVKFTSTDEIVFVVTNLILIKLFLNVLSNPHIYLEQVFPENSSHMNQIRINILIISSIIEDIYRRALDSEFYLTKKNNTVYRGYEFQERKKMSIFKTGFNKIDDYQENIIFNDSLPQELIHKFFEFEKTSKENRIEIKFKELIISIKNIFSETN